MFPDMQRYMEMKYGPKLPDEEVTEEDFVAAMVATGVPESEAKTAAFVSKGLGASTKVGDRMLKIK